MLQEFSAPHLFDEAWQEIARCRCRGVREGGNLCWTTNKTIKQEVGLVGVVKT